MEYSQASAVVRMALSASRTPLLTSWLVLTMKALLVPPAAASESRLFCATVCSSGAKTPTTNVGNRRSSGQRARGNFAYVGDLGWLALGGDPVGREEDHHAMGRIGQRYRLGVRERAGEGRRSRGKAIRCFFGQRSEQRGRRARKRGNFYGRGGVVGRAATVATVAVTRDRYTNVVVAGARAHIAEEVADAPRRKASAETSTYAPLDAATISVRRAGDKFIGNGAGLVNSARSRLQTFGGSLATGWESRP